MSLVAAGVLLGFLLLPLLNQFAVLIDNDVDSKGLRARDHSNQLALELEEVLAGVEAIGFEDLFVFSGLLLAYPHNEVVYSE